MATKDLFALRKQILIDSALSKETKQIWRNYFEFNDLLDSDSVELILRTTSRRIELNLNDQKLNLSKSFLEIIQLFVKETELPLAEVLLMLWNSQGNESDLSRLHMPISQLNLLLRTELGLSNVF